MWYFFKIKNIYLFIVVLCCGGWVGTLQCICGSWKTSCLGQFSSFNVGSGDSTQVVLLEVSAFT